MVGRDEDSRSEPPVSTAAHTLTATTHVCSHTCKHTYAHKEHHTYIHKERRKRYKSRNMFLNRNAIQFTISIDTFTESKGKGFQLRLRDQI